MVSCQIHFLHWSLHPTLPGILQHSRPHNANELLTPKLWYLLQPIIDGTFSMDLPAVIQNALEPPTKPEPNHNNRKRTPEKPDANGQNQQTPPQCGEPSINASIHPPWHLKDGETYTEHFVHRIDHSKVPNCDICLNFHIRGTCHTKCSRADTHVPFSNLSK